MIINGQEKNKIDIREYVFPLYEILDRYERDDVVFPNTKIRFSNKKNKVKEVLKATSMGIPFPNILFIELQSGQMIVAESSEKLKSIIGFMSDEYAVIVDELFSEQNDFIFGELPSIIKRKIKMTEVACKIVRYGTPKYMQLYIAGYMENLSFSHMEAIRRELYKDSGMEIIQNTMSNGGWNLYYINREYEFIVFLTYVVNFIIEKYDGSNIGQFQMQDRMFNLIKKNSLFITGIFDVFVSLHEYVVRFNEAAYLEKGNQNLQSFIKFFPSINPPIGHICGIAVAVCDDAGDIIGAEAVISEIFHRTISVNNVRDSILCDYLNVSDLSFRSLERIIKYICGERI